MSHVDKMCVLVINYENGKPLQRKYEIIEPQMTASRAHHFKARSLTNPINIVTAIENNYLVANATESEIFARKSYTVTLP